MSIRPVEKSIYDLTKMLLVRLPYKDLDYTNGLLLLEQSFRFIKPGINSVVVIDFSDVNLVDEHGLSSIMKIWSDCSEKNIKFIICNLNEVVLSIIKYKGIDSLIDISSSVEEATLQSHLYIDQMKDLQDNINNYSSIYKDNEDEYCIVEYTNNKTKVAI